MDVAGLAVVHVVVSLKCGNFRHLHDRQFLSTGPEFRISQLARPLLCISASIRNVIVAMSRDKYWWYFGISLCRVRPVSLFSEFSSGK